MILSDLNTPFDNSEQTPKSTHYWHLDKGNYSEQQIQEMPTWIKTNKEEYTIDEQYDVANINTFSEMQKLAYDIVKVSRYSNGHKYPKQKQRTPNLTSFAKIVLAIMFTTNSCVKHRILHVLRDADAISHVKQANSMRTF